MDRIEHKVKSTFDIGQQVEQNPLLAAGLAVAGGFLLGSLTGGRSHSPGSQTHDAGAYAGGYRPSGHDYAYATRPAPSMPLAASRPVEGEGILGGIAQGLREGLRQQTGTTSFEAAVGAVSAALMGILMEKAKEALEENLPGFRQHYEEQMGQARHHHAPMVTPLEHQEAMAGRHPGTVTTAPGGAGILDATDGPYPAPAFDPQSDPYPTATRPSGETKGRDDRPLTPPSA
jgi:predicted lipid-binding transport protein (Tim44 family)